MSSRPPSWSTLGRVDPRSLVDARHQVHWASQIPSALGFTRAEPMPDWSHYALRWKDGVRALVGVGVQPTSGTETLHAALRPADLTLLVLGEDFTERAALPLAGRTLNEGIEWLAEEIARQSGELPVPLKRPQHEMPDHAVAHGTPFALDEPAAFEELAHWFALTARALEDVSAARSDASAVLVWPHHFDIATLITLDGGADAQEARTVGAGMTPGDGSYPEPYLYVTPWPYPKDVTPPALEGGGHWHSEGWFGAVLTGSNIVAAPATDRDARVDAFLRSALAGSFELLGP